MELVAAVRETIFLICAIRNHRSMLRRNVHHCEQLRDYVVSLEPVVKSVDTTTSAPEVLMAFSRLLATLKSADCLIKKAEAMGIVSSFVRARSLTEEFRDVCSRLSEAVNGLQLAQSTVGGRERADLRQGIQELTEALKNAQSPQQLDAHQHPVHKEMRAILDQINDRTLGADRGRQMLYSLMEDAVGKAQFEAERVQSLEEIAVILEDCERDVDTSEEFDLLNIEAALGSQAPNSRGHAKIPADFFCPINLAVMRKPVLVPETGVSYEAACIRRWFKSGNITCPKTNVRLSSTRLVRNIALENVIQDWMDRRGILLEGHGGAEDVFDGEDNSQVDAIRAGWRRMDETVDSLWTPRSGRTEFHEAGSRTSHPQQGANLRHNSNCFEKEAASYVPHVLNDIASNVSIARLLLEDMGKQIGNNPTDPLDIQRSILWQRLIHFVYPKIEGHLKNLPTSGGIDEGLETSFRDCCEVEHEFLRAIQKDADMSELEGVKQFKLCVDSQDHLLQALESDADCASRSCSSRRSLEHRVRAQGKPSQGLERQLRMGSEWRSLSETME